MKKIPKGKYAGKTLSQVPTWYMEFIIKNEYGLDWMEEFKPLAEKEIQKIKAVTKKREEEAEYNQDTDYSEQTPQVNNIPPVSVGAIKKEHPVLYSRHSVEFVANILGVTPEKVKKMLRGKRLPVNHIGLGKLLAIYFGKAQPSYNHFKKC